MNFVFDVDGTLTPSRCSIDPQFRQWFMNWIEHRAVWLVTGSDYAKTVEQLGTELCERVTGVYNCLGNELHTAGVQQRVKTFALNDEQTQFLGQLLKFSLYPTRTGQHIESRGSMVNFSVVGRGADREQRADYHRWDLVNAERGRFAVLIESEFPELSAQVAGETGIDIVPRGWDKSQIADDLKPYIYFGDRCEPGGNDWPAAKLAQEFHQVRDWRETWSILQQRYLG
jgi:phosphomannomutase